MLVTWKSAKKCCKFCDADYGASSNGRAKDKKRRQIKRTERQTWKKGRSTVKFTTENSEHRLWLDDTDEWWYSRHPRNEDVETLRRDEEPILVKKVYVLEVGKRAEMLLDIRQDGVLTLRTTSVVDWMGHDGS